MTDKNSFNESNREYVSLSDTYIGHLTTGGLTAFCVGFAYWIFSLFFVELRESFQKNIVFLLLTVIIAELLVSLLQRPLVIRAQHASPGGFLYAFYEVFVTPSVAFALAVVIFRSTFIAGIWLALFGCAVAFLAVVTKPWRRGLSREEIREKYNETREFVRTEVQKERAKQHRDS